ncbi:MAG: hypothetical protein GY822_03305 [Deltaproteobacteria bacterium]|nr:hypothetical protein [Deltaproteobacteria bacterium]
MTDTEFSTFANTNDRGRDPRSVYKKNQNRMTGIFVVKGAYTLDVFDGITFKAKQKTILDSDQRDQSVEGDDYFAVLTFNDVSVETPITDELSFLLGAEIGVWWEQHRSGDVVAGVANYPDYLTIRPKVYSDFRYTYGSLTFWYHVEYINKFVDVTDDRFDFSYLNVIRSMAMVTASF